ncbi:MAG TPA: tetratricopeptide repeat protein [Pyrinomonadaceae bacterium]|jgi:tetratricopeptide (TPR) repeat protein
MTNDASYEYDIFLSHNHKEQDWTEKLAERLEQEDWQGRKLSVFFSPWDIRPGQSIPLKIEQGLMKSRKVGLIMSPAAMDSAWVELERLVTTHIALTAREERLIPLLRHDCEIPPLLRPLLPIDFTDDARFEESYQRLLSVIKDEPMPRRARRAASVPASLPASIPRPPAVGFVARRDAKGRDIVEQLREELAPGRNRLVVLWGAGGVGKTTLAAEAALSLVGVFGGRIVWASPELRADLTISTLLDEIATQLGRADLRPLAFAPKEEAVRALLAESHALVILDNFETIAPAEQTRCADWLAKRAPCPALITTRERIAGAHNISIYAMTIAEASEFVELWINREAHSPHAFAGLERERIIEAAGRNPLVLQWVLARIDSALEPGDVLDELTEGEGDAARRVFDSSFKLPQLGDDGRDTLLALSLFVPDASRNALAETAGFDTTDKKRLNEAITRLSSLWLIETTPGNKRLKIEGLTRELTKSHLSKDDRANQFRQRFVAYLLRYAEAYIRPTPEDFDALEAEKDNILNAMDVAFDLKDWLSVTRLMAAINLDGVNGLLMMHGYWDEAIRRGRQAIESAQNLGHAVDIAGFTHSTALVLQNRGELEEARRLYNDSLEISKSLGDQSNIASTTSQIGIVLFDEGKLAESKAKHEESLAIRRKLGEQQGVAIDLHQLAILAQEQGDLEEAQRLYNQSLDINKKLGNLSSIASTLHELGRLAQAHGELEEARRLCNESLDINKKLGNLSGVAMTLHQLSILAQAHGELEEARRLCNESLDINKKLGSPSGVAMTLNQLGIFAAEEGDRTKAVRLLREALSIFEKLKSPNAEIVRQNLKLLEGGAS